MLSFQEYQEKILLTVIGKSIGGILGAKNENQKQWNPVTDIETQWPAILPANDDLDIQILWLEALQEYGPGVTAEDLARIWQDRCQYYFCEYGSFLYNVQRGIMPPLSGNFGNEYFRESNGCPIRAEIWGLVTPGMPEIAARYAKMDASLDHDISGESSFIEQFWAAAVSMIFQEKSQERILADAAAFLPESSIAYNIFQTLPVWCADRKLADRAVWRRIIRAFGSSDASKAATNFAICLFALFRGGRDLRKVMTLCLNSGWDVDCTMATCAAFLCGLHGESILPDGWKEKAGGNLLCGIAVKHKTASLQTVTKDIAECGLETALFHNPSFRMKDMPNHPVRHRKKAPFQAEIRYEDAPVLSRKKNTRISFQIFAENTDEQDLQWSVEGPAYCRISPDGGICRPCSGKPENLSIEIGLADPSGPLPDKNKFKLHFGGKTLEFGLAGCRTWKIYGPYWDMWDTERFSECPFHNEKVDCMPGALPGHMGDSYIQYASLNRRYLDESALVSGGALPMEDPVTAEAHTDLLTNRFFDQFTGAACWYLVRDFSFAETPVTANKFAVGRSGPCRIWLNGSRIYEQNSVVSWAQHSDGGRTGELSFLPGRNRLVVKLTRPADDLKFSISPLREPDPIRGISWFDDNSVDLY